MDHSNTYGVAAISLSKARREICQSVHSAFGGYRLAPFRGLGTMTSTIIEHRRGLVAVARRYVTGELAPIVLALAGVSLLVPSRWNQSVDGAGEEFWPERGGRRAACASVFA